MQKFSTKDSENYRSNYIAAVIINNIKKLQCGLSDTQIEALIPIIRNSIYTAHVNMRVNPYATFEYFDKFVPPDWLDCESLKL